MKNKKIFFIAILVVLFVLLVICGYYLINKTAIKCNNKTAFYVEEFLEETPTSKTVLNEIDKTTQEFLDIDAFNTGFYFSKFHKQYIADVVGLDNNDRNRIKNQYFNEVIMLRLKVLAYQEDIEIYNKLFDTYIYDIEDNLYTNVRLVSLFISDEKHPILYESELFELVEKSFVRAYDNCDNITMKFYLLNEMIQFYSHFEECFSEETFYRELMAELVNNNKVLLQEILSDQLY